MMLRDLSIGKHQKFISLIKDELICEIMKTFTGLRTKMYPYIKDNDKTIKTSKIENEINFFKK